LTILEAIIAGERDPKQLAALCSSRIKASRETVAAGSVIKDPSTGPTVRIASHQAAMVDLPRLATFARQASAKRKIGRELAIAITTTTKIGSAASIAAA
jgi:hypothetical protein